MKSLCMRIGNSTRNVLYNANAKILQVSYMEYRVRIHYSVLFVNKISCICINIRIFIEIR
jgi:hypothetical protein